MRQEALKWWRGLDPLDQLSLFDIYRDENFTMAQFTTELTGREVELIYNKQNQQK